MWLKITAGKEKRRERYMAMLGYYETERICWVGKLQLALAMLGDCICWGIMKLKAYVGLGNYNWH